MTGSIRRWIIPLLGLGITGFFLWLLLSKVEWNEVSGALSRISLVSLLIALGFLAVGYTVRVVRWWSMLRVLDPGVSLSACGWPFLVSIAVNNLLPFRAGDALRIVGFRKQLRAPAMRLLGTLLIERLLDLMTLLVFFFLGLSGVTASKVPEYFIRLTSFIAIGGAVAVLAILFFTRQIERLFYWIADRPGLVVRGWSAPMKEHIGHLLDALRVLQTPTFTLKLIALSVIVWGFEGAVFATVAHALSPESATAGPWFALSTGTLATLIPSSPGYVGTFDYFAMLGMMAYGAERSSATAFAVVVHVVLWLPLTIAGMTYFLMPGARMMGRQVTASIFTKEEPT